MPYNAGGLLDDVAFMLQSNPRYTRGIRLDGLNRGIEKLVAFASTDSDVREVLNPPDPTGQFTWAIEWPLPADILMVESVSCNGYPLKPATQEQFLATRAEFSPALAPIPSIYYIRAGLFLDVWPRPSQQYTWQVYGIFKPADLVDDTDPIPLDRLYSDALVSYAAWWCLNGQTGEGERAAAMQANYLQQRAEAKANKQLNVVYSIKNAKPQR